MHWAFTGLNTHAYTLLLSGFVNFLVHSTCLE